MTRRDGYAIAECDHDGQLPGTRPTDVTWIGVVTLPGNRPDSDGLVNFETARDIAVTLVRQVIAYRADPQAAYPDAVHDSYAVIHVTPDGWRPVMWAMPDYSKTVPMITLTLHEGAQP